MENFFNSTFFEPSIELGKRFAAFMPNLFTMLLVIIIGVVLAWLISLLVAKIAAVTKFDNLVNRFGLWEYIRKSGVYETPSKMLGSFLYWFIVLVFFLISLSALNVSILNQISSQFFTYLPNLLIAIIVLIIGLLLASFIEKLVLIGCVNAQIGIAKFISIVSKVVVIIFFVAISLEVLGIGRNVINSAFSIIFGGIIFSLSLAFGLGGKDAAKEYLEKQIKRGVVSKEEKGDRDDISHI